MKKKLSDDFVLSVQFPGYKEERLQCIYCGNFGKDKFPGHGKSCLALKVDRVQNENVRLREALFGEYCDCNLKDATTRPGTHASSCKYLVVMKRIFGRAGEYHEEIN